jgi:hypothetical protein
MNAARRRNRDGALSRIASAMTSVAGITTALTTIMTSIAAVLGLVVHHQSKQLQQAHAVVSEQARQIKQLTAGTAVSKAPASPGAASSSSPASVTNVGHYLSDLTATVDDGGLSVGQVVIAADPYPNSISFDCDGGGGAGRPDEAYDVAGSSTFTTEVGIADNMQNATDVIATVTFTNESGQLLGKPVQVSLGHPVKLKLSTGNVTQLGMTCSGRDGQTDQVANSFQVALGNANVS